MKIDEIIQENAEQPKTDAIGNQIDARFLAAKAKEKRQENGEDPDQDEATLDFPV
jgi:hypothetical protein